MRIGTATFNDGQLAQMTRLSTEIAAAQGAISTGKQRTTASDDPASAARSARLARTQADNARYGLGLDLADERLGIMDKTMEGFQTQLVRIKELALLASSDTASPADRQIHLGEIRQIQSQLVSLGNAQDASGAYLLSGARASTPAFAQDAATGIVAYQGLGTAAQVAVGDTARLATADAAPQALGTLIDNGGKGRSVFQVVQDLVDTLAAPEPDPNDAAALALRHQAFADAVDGAGAGIDRIANVRADIGARQNRVESERNRLDALGDALTTARSKLDDADYAATITRLTQARTILEATQKSFAQVSALSLFNEIH